MKKILLFLLTIYQKFFTLFGYGSCRYYPSCSEYTKWQFEKNTLPKAFFFSAKRILSCNQFFIGGPDYPVVATPKATYGKIIDVMYWYVPKSNQKSYLIKSF